MDEQLRTLLKLSDWRVESVKWTHQYWILFNLYMGARSNCRYSWRRRTNVCCIIFDLNLQHVRTWITQSNSFPSSHVCCWTELCTFINSIRLWTIIRCWSIYITISWISSFHAYGNWSRWYVRHCKLCWLNANESFCKWTLSNRINPRWTIHYHHICNWWSCFLCWFILRCSRHTQLLHICCPLYPHALFIFLDPFCTLAHLWSETATQ